MNSTFSNASNLFSPEFGPLFGSLLLAECILGIIGNSIVLLAFAKKYVQFTPFCMLLLNLSIADIITDIATIPRLIEGVYKYLEAINGICGIFKFGVLVNLGFRVNFCTAAYISCMREKSIENGSSKKILSRQVVSRFIWGTWVISLVSTLPLCFMITTDPKANSCKPIDIQSLLPRLVYLSRTVLFHFSDNSGY